MLRTAAIRTLLVAAVLVAAPTAVGAQRSDGQTPEGTEWHLVSYPRDGKLTSVPWDVDATLTLEGEQASGSAGCNYFHTTYELDSDSLTFDYIATTDVGCPRIRTVIEAGYVAALSTTTEWLMDKGIGGSSSLLLRDSDGTTVAEFQALTIGLTLADVGALTKLLDSQAAAIDRLTERVGTLRKRVKALEDA